MSSMTTKSVIYGVIGLGIFSNVMYIRLQLSLMDAKLMNARQ